MSDHPKANGAIARLEAAIDTEVLSELDQELMDVARCQLGNLLVEIKQLEAENAELKEIISMVKSQLRRPMVGLTDLMQSTGVDDGQ